MSEDSPEESQSTATDTFISHLIELRSRLVKACMAILGAFLVLYFIWPGPIQIYDALASPMMASLPAGAKMIATGVVTPFVIPMKLTLLLAFVVSLPWILYQIWAFVAPGLYAHEKRLVAPLVISSSGLFMGGVAFCYFFVFGKVFKFINELAPKSINVTPDIENYFDFVMSMCLAFGVTFEVPIIVIVLVRMGWVSVATLKSVRRYVVVGATVLAAIVAPPDMWSMVVLTVALCVLYEVGILVAPLFAKMTQAPAEAS